MSKKYTPRSLKLDQLVLDKDNPRFAELYTGSEKESDIIKYLLFNESADEVAEAIFQAEEFYEDRPQWVFKDKDKYIVKDGNRRCAAVKALQLPTKYGLDTKEFKIEKLPVLEYNLLTDLEHRIRIEHNSSLFKKWGRIAKALEIYRLFSSGQSLDSLKDIDSAPKELMKLASFYHEASKIKGEDFKKLVREGRGKTGGKTIIFERLFKARTTCGYKFKRNTSEIIIADEPLFISYIEAIVPYLIDNPDTTSRKLDDEGVSSFLSELKPYGFPPAKPTPTPSTAGGTSSTSDSSASSSSAGGSSTSGTGGSGGGQGQGGSGTNGSSSSGNGSSSGTTSSRGSTKTKPTPKRKKLPAPLKTLIDECYKLDENNFANAKTALTRVTFECVLKYVVEQTMKSNGKPISTSPHFNLAFKDKSGKKLPYTNFTYLKTKFAELISDTGTRKAFEVFDIELPHQIIHNYKVAAVPTQAKGLCDNLVVLIEFMLQDESDLISSLDISKL